SDAKLLRSRLAKVQGNIKMVGFSDIKPGHVINLAGFGDRFNGKAYVSGVVHHFATESTWYTELTIGLNQKWFHQNFDDINESPASGLTPGIGGLQVGTVTNIHEDPDGEFRVQVRIPIIGTEDEGVWARVSLLDAGDNRGTFFRPEVDDEVIVGFVNSDPRDPVILGMLHSSAKAPPIEPEEENNEKGIITRSELRLLFNDDLNVITLDTPNGNSIVISEDEGAMNFEDENGNKIIMNADGILLESAKDIIMKASGDVTVEGTNLTNTANSQYLAEGNSGAELSTSGQAVIKGSIVQIN
ncbi:MAG: phage baseplate assembly protein V, partial [Bacteroidota bacterium]